MAEKESSALNPIAIAIRQPITVTVGIILTILAGLVALNRVPIQLAPEVEDTVIAVTTTWENANPQEVESEIIDEQEERLQSVSNLRQMTSVSQRGQGEIRLEFNTGTNKDIALREVSDKLREVPSYPENVDEPVITDTDPDSRDYIAWVIVACENQDFDITTLFDVLDRRLIPQFDRLPGVSEVNLLGGRERETQIHVQPTLLAQRGLTMPDFVRAIRETNANFSGGALEDGKFDIRVRSVGRFEHVQEVLDTIIAQGESGPIYVRDVADVEETYKEQQTYVRSRGRPVMAINFQREIGANVIEVMEGIREEIARVNQPGSLLDNIAQSENVGGKIRLVLTYDQTTYIDQALFLVQENILLGGTLAMIVLLLFLRSLRSLLIIGIAIPISIIGSIVAMYALGRTVNVISLAGMAFSVGMVVDNSIVVLENIYRHLEMGKRSFRAAYDGATEVAGAVLASTLTTIVVFIPILLIEEQAGQLFRDIALAICAAVAISYVVAVTVIPSALALFLRNKVYDPKEKEAIKATKSSGWFKTIFFPFWVIKNLPYIMRRFLEMVSRSWIVRFAIVIIFIVGTVVGAVLLVPPIDYLPSGNRNIVFGLLIPPPGYNIDALSDYGRRIEKHMEPFWEAFGEVYDFEDGLKSRETLMDEAFDDEVNSTEGLPQYPAAPMPDAPMITPPPLVNYFQVSTAGGMFHGAISADPERVVDMVPLFQGATSQTNLPGFIAFAFQLPLFRIAGTTGSAVNIDLSGPDLGRVSQSAGALYGRLVENYGRFAVQPDPSNFNVPSQELQVVPNLLHLSDIGMTASDLGLIVQVNSDGAFVGEYDLEQERIDFKVVSENSLTNPSLHEMKTIPVATPGGEVVPLGNLAKFARVTEPDAIKRVARQRAVTLEFTPPDGLSLQNAIQQIEGHIAELKEQGAILPDVEANLAGSASKLNAMQTALMGDGTVTGFLTSSLFLALLVVYLLMCVLFQSWIYPLVIMLTVPMATFGGLLALSGVHYWSMIDRYMPLQNMDVLTILGFVILAGVVVNNAILIVHQTFNFMRGISAEDAEHSGPVSPQRAIALSVQSRVRPIFMSTFSSVGGMLPLVLMPGAGSELYRGLGSVVVGGLFVSVFFTLVLVPVVLSLLFDVVKQEKWMRDEDPLS